MSRDTRFKIEQLAYLLLLTQYVRTFNLTGPVKYLVPLVLSLIFLLFGKERIRLSNAGILVPGAVYIVLGLVSCAASEYWGHFTVKTAGLIFIPSFCALILYERVFDRDIDICKTLFLAFALYNSAFFSLYPFSVIIEANRALPYGLFIIYFLINEDWDYCALAFFFCFISHKRITLLGVGGVLFFILAVTLLNKFCRTDKKKIYTVTAAVSVAAAYLIAYLIHSGKLIELLDSVNVYAMGRAVIWKVFRDFADFNIGFTGRGLGYVMSRLDELRVFMREGAWFGNLHSDFYVGYIELGFIGFGVWIASYFPSYYSLTQNPDRDSRAEIFTLAAIIYTFILFLTDNPLIYIEYWFPMNLMLLSMANRHSGERERYLYNQYRAANETI